MFMFEALTSMPAAWTSMGDLLTISFAGRKTFSVGLRTWITARSCNPGVVERFSKDGRSVERTSSPAFALIWTTTPWTLVRPDAHVAWRGAPAELPAALSRAGLAC